MDRHLFELVHESVPKVNLDVVNGLAVREIKQFQSYITRIFRTVESDFPPGLKFENIVRCTPQEEFNIITNNRKNRQRTFEMSRSDVFMVKVLFSYKGEQLRPIPLFLPFVGPAGIIHLRGAQFHISPVLSDASLSVDPKEIFIPLNRGRLKFKRLGHSYRIQRNGEGEAHDVIWSQIHNNRVKTGGSVTNGKTTLVHYLLMKYGTKRAFAEFANADVVVGTADQVTTEQYPADKWDIFTTGRVKGPKYIPTNIALAVPKDQYNEMVGALVTGFFFVVDLFPSFIKAEYIDGSEDEIRLWMVRLGVLIWGLGPSYGRLIEDVQNHKDSLDGYIDAEVRAVLASDDIFVEDIYQFFAHIMETYSTRVTQSSTQVTSMYGKRLMILRYVAFDIVKAINNFMFSLKSNKRKAMTREDIINEAERHLRTTKILELSRNHPEVSSVSSPGDNKIWKLTGHIVLQSDYYKKRGTHSKSVTTDPSKFLSASIAEVGSYNTPAKSEPTGRNKINPFVQTTEDGQIKRNPELIEVIDQTQLLIQR